MKNKIAFIFTYFWLFLLLCTGVGILLFADKEERVSDSEKRMLAGFPDSSAESIFSGEFSAGFENFLSDGIFLRDSIARASESALGIFSAASYEDTMLLESIAMADEISGNIDGENPTAPEAEAQPQPAEAETAAPASEGEADFGLYMLCPDGSRELLSDVSEYRVERVAQVLNDYRSFLPEDGHVFYSCIPVTNYRDVVVKTGKYIGWNENFTYRFDELLVDGAHMVSAPNVLNEHLMDEHLYFQADHHWTPLAAHYLIAEMMRIQGVPVVPYDEYEYKVGKFYNTQTGLADDLDLMYPLLPSAGNIMRGGNEAEAAPLIVYDDENYVAYLAGGNDVWTRYTSGFSTGRNALVIGDSFTTAFVPHLLAYYDSVHHADPRYYDDVLNGGPICELIEHHSIDDIYIILSYDNGIDSPMSSETLEYLLYD